jgi:hypothetical protein
MRLHNCHAREQQADQPSQKASILNKTFFSGKTARRGGAKVHTLGNEQVNVSPPLAMRRRRPNWRGRLGDGHLADGQFPAAVPHQLPHCKVNRKRPNLAETANSRRIMATPRSDQRAGGCIYLVGTTWSETRSTPRRPTSRGHLGHLRGLQPIRGGEGVGGGSKTGCDFDKFPSTAKVASFKRISWASWQIGHCENPRGAMRAPGNENHKRKHGSSQVGQVRVGILASVANFGNRLTKSTNGGLRGAPTSDAVPHTCLIAIIILQLTRAALWGILLLALCRMGDSNDHKPQILILLTLRKSHGRR